MTVSIALAVRVFCWMAITALGISAIAVEGSLFSMPYGVYEVRTPPRAELVGTIDIIVGMFDTTGEDHISGTEQSALTSEVLPIFISDVSRHLVYAMQVCSIGGVVLSFISLCVWLLGNGCGWTHTKVLAVVLDVVTTLFFTAAWSLVLAAYLQPLRQLGDKDYQDAHFHRSFSEDGTLGCALPCLVICSVLSMVSTGVSSYLACCISPSRETSFLVQNNDPAVPMANYEMN